MSASASLILRRTEQITKLLNDDVDPFLSLQQAAKKSRVPLSTLSQAITDGKLESLVMPDQRRYVPWSEVQRYAAALRAKRAPKAHVLNRLAMLARMDEAQGLPKLLSEQHDRVSKNQA